MNLRETAKLLATIQEFYPNFCDRRDIEHTTAVWQSLFANDSYSSVDNAVQAYICQDERGFPPRIGALKELIWQQNNPYMSENTAWVITKQAMIGPSDKAQERFEKLPDVLKRCIGNPDTLRKWSAADEEHLETVIGSNFRRTFREVVQREKAVSKLPEQLRERFPEILPVYTPVKVQVALPTSDGVECPVGVKKLIERLGGK